MPLTETKEKFPVHLFKRMGELGYLCVAYPPEYGGGGLGRIGHCICCEELGRANAGISSSVMMHGGLGTSIIYHHGSEAQQRKYLAPAIRGEKISAFALTEPNAGSDVSAIETTATSDGDHYIINGTKMFITNGPIADYFIVVASTDRSKGGRGLSTLIMDSNTPGLQVDKLRKMSLVSSETAELTFDNCCVPRENFIGTENQGLSYVLEDLDVSRVSHAARGLGLAQCTFEAALKYAKERVQFGRPIAKFQAISFKLAAMATEIEAARWLTYYAAWLCDQGKRCSKEASMAKVYVGNVAKYVADETIQIHGGYGFMLDSPVQRYYRDARLQSVGEGTTEIQNMVIARELGIG